MPVYQINIWVCEICNAIQTTNEEVGPYSDPVVEPPEKKEWEYLMVGEKEKLACPGCVAKEYYGLRNYETRI